jgi:hypothetical protein
MIGRMIAWTKGLRAGFEDWLRVRFNRPYRTLTVEEDLPERLRRRTLYVIQEDGFLEHVAMLCPCGCGRTLHMNLIPDERPCWHLTRHPGGTATLHPSIWRKKDCGSHFWFRRGRVQWCRGDEH